MGRLPLTKTRIIRAAVEHVDDVAPLFDAYRRFYTQTPDIDGARVFLTERLERDESVLFLALTDETPAGFTQLYPVFSSVRMRHAWILNDLFVASDRRRLGVARLLMERAIDFGRETGARTISLQTAKDNTPARALYEALGFHLEVEFDEFVLTL